MMKFAEVEVKVVSFESDAIAFMGGGGDGSGEEV